MKKLIITGIGILGIMFFISCGGADTKPASDTTSAEQPKATTGTTSDYDPKRGEGKFDSTNVTIGPLDAAMAAKGKSVAETKCFSCHKTSDEKLVGPGWKGITERKTPYWIMNFITNPDPMIDKDPELQAQLEICLVRMPNQNLVDLEARELVEFMRQNDGAK
ncbi:MAG: cytochrome c [Chitinophagaceae bacterium]|nr:cytochrome c [Chitinophagaceae bacterium]MBP6987478.1 cytochrome c [Ferruginibacter sp.]MBK7089446.1 cytochrome c [Chitinophagaceae bacterium]MBK7347169.1 cytochrome c [Chitinophagaceae bacterium]MBK8928943.1 cytochrome c [Chitinophagaceae bacterium]